MVCTTVVTVILPAVVARDAGARFDGLVDLWFIRIHQQLHTVAAPEVLTAHCPLLCINPPTPRLHTTRAAIAERDTNGDVLWGWMYPAVEDSLKAVIVSKVSWHSCGALLRIPVLSSPLHPRGAARAARIRAPLGCTRLEGYVFPPFPDFLAALTMPDSHLRPHAML